jgi:esterase/lipase
MLRKLLIGLFSGLAVVVAALVAMAPADLVNQAQPRQLAADLDEWLARSEGAVHAQEEIIPGTEKRIRWYRDRKNSLTPLSIVYFHGFSATRMEIAPVGELIADRLGANLFETRLTGHGHLQNPLVGVRAEDWLNDAAEALAIGAAIGEEIVVMGTSTGATLALAMTGHETFEPVSAIVLLSPNFGPKDSSAEFLTWPGGPQLAYMVAGETRSWTPRNELQQRYWSTTYPMDAVIEMMRLVKYVRSALPMRLEQSLLTIYSPADTVVDTAWIARAFEQITSPRKALVEIPASGDPSNHVLAGDIMAPENNEALAEQVLRFIAGDEAPPSGTY